MKTAHFADLELQVDHLLNVIRQLKIENNTLRNKLAISIRETTVLRDQKERSLAKIKHIILQLKEKLT